MHGSDRLPGDHLRNGDGGMIDCPHWSDCGVRGGGCCAIGRGGGRPSIGTCRRCIESDGSCFDRPRPLRSAAISWVIAEASALVSETRDEVRDQRWRACTGLTLEGVPMAEACPALERGADGHEYCRDCRCPRWAGARLKRKIRMPAATCPRGRWEQTS